MLKCTILPALKFGIILLIVIGTVILIRALDARHLPDLALWHRARLTKEFTEKKYHDRFTLSDYMDLEDALFRELEAKVHQRIPPDMVSRFSRYAPAGNNNPTTFQKNWNRTYELIPTKIKGGALLLHGLTDSPYSLRRCAQILHQQGYYVLSLRLPGHGTIPGALRSTSWRDWMTAVHIGARHVRDKIGGDQPFMILGYSNGGALAVKYCLDALEDTRSVMPDQVILFSPAIGINRLAFFSRCHPVLSIIPYFEKFRWFDIAPEYDPYKYNSFPKNGGNQSYRLSREIQKALDRLHPKGVLRQLPPLLTFQSLADATVLTEAVHVHLYQKLDNQHSELVMFDVNRSERYKPFMRSEPHGILARLERGPSAPHILTIITNADTDSREIVAKTRKAGAMIFTTTPTGLSWPEEVFSLSHVAIPFPPDDPLYGNENPPAATPGKGLPLGRLCPRGERDLLSVSVNQLMRLRFNPFFDYIEKRLTITGSTLIEKNK